MNVTVHSVLGLKQVLGRHRLEVELSRGSTLEGLFEYMKQRWGDKFTSYVIDPKRSTVLPHMRVMVNGREIRSLQGMETLLKEGDEVLFLPEVSGC